MVLASTTIGGRVKSWCPSCRIRYINGGPADLCLACDGTLAALPRRPVKTPKPRVPLSEEAYWKLVLEPFANDY